MWKLAAFLAVAAFVSAEEPQGAWLLSSKSAQSAYAVEGMDYVIEYGLYNVGDRPATKVTLDDRASYPTQYFQIVRGVLQISIERIPAGANVTHAVVLKPLMSGLFNYTAAQISYRPDENSKDIRVGLTTSPGEGYVYRQKEYERRFASKSQYFLTYLLMVAPGSLGALLYYIQSKNRYEAIDAEAKKAKTH